MKREINVLPSFTLAGYEKLIREIIHQGFRVKPASALPEKQRNTVYLRHDIDFSIALSANIAEIEHSLGVSATYYILLTGPYNPFHEESVRAIKKIREYGHEIGLHYDLKNYPTDKREACRKLKEEILLLESLANCKINTIVMHEPFRGTEDFFAEKTWPINPTFYQKTEKDLCYVSDSCRAWRDDALIRFLDRKLPQTQLLLNTHPESWLATKRQHRITYLEQTLIPAAMKSTYDYFSKAVRNVWETHSAAVNGFGDENEY